MAAQHARREDAPVADPERIVVESCAGGAPAVVTIREGGPSLRAAFTAFRNERIELELMDPGPEDVPEGTPCHVSFVYRGRPFFFTSAARYTERPREHVLLWVDLPLQITNESARAAFRIPSGGELAPPVEIVADDGVHMPATLANLSLTGMFLEFAAGSAPALLPEQRVDLIVHLEDEPIRLAGVVRRVEPTGAALSFPDAVSDAPENPIRRAVAALERSWHSRLRR